MSEDRSFPLVMAGFDGMSVPPRLAARLRDGSVGGVVLFSRNLEGPAQVRALCREIRAAAGKRVPPPIVAIDQEGGRVRRLKDPGFTQFPPARSCSLLCCKAEGLAFTMGAASAAEIRAVGIDVNFAPVLDVDSDPHNWVIGDRSFAGAPRQAAALGIAFMRGTLSRRILPVGKHFPGHGSTAADSHKELPVVTSSRQALLSRDVLPFSLAIRARIPALMTAHVLYPALDKEFPATLSRRILTGLLRDRLRFRGVVFSDALEMKALSRYGSIGRTAVQAALAGCDVLLVCRGEEEQDEVIESLSRAARENPEFLRAAAPSRLRMARLRETLDRWGPSRGTIRLAGAKAHREAALLLAHLWESSGQTSSADKSGSIGEG